MGKKCYLALLHKATCRRIHVTIDHVWDVIDKYQKYIFSATVANDALLSATNVHVF